MNLKELVAKAKQQQGYTSDAQLAERLNVSDVTVMRWRKETSFPSDEHIVGLCIVAHVDAAFTLAELKANCGKSEQIRTIYKRYWHAVGSTWFLIIITVQTAAATIERCILCKMFDANPPRSIRLYRSI